MITMASKLLQWLQIICILGVLPHPSQEYTGKVLIVSFDGFRWDYLNKSPNLTNFKTIQDQGVKVKYMNAGFMSASVPSHYTMATGLYEETHGIVGNKMYDPVMKKSFTKSNVEPVWWEGGEPIWITTLKNGKKSGAYYWPGFNVRIQGRRSEGPDDYNEAVPFKDRVDEVVSWFTKKNMDFAALYHHEPDKTGHYSGPDSMQTLQMIRETDNNLGYLLKKMEEANLKKTVNLIVTGDHGMTNVNKAQHIILTKFTNPALIKISLLRGAICNILPVDGKENELYNVLNANVAHGKVYRKKDIPEIWHYKNNIRILPILVVMDPGWMCLTYDNDVDILKRKGMHGYNNNLKDMRTIFLAMGPDFKKKYEADPITTVDIYPLMCELLGIKPASHQGSLAKTQNLLVNGVKTQNLLEKPISGASPHQKWMKPRAVILLLLSLVLVVI